MVVLYSCRDGIGSSDFRSGFLVVLVVVVVWYRGRYCHGSRWVQISGLVHGSDGRLFLHLCSNGTYLVMDRVIARLQQPFPLEYIPVEAQYQELLHMDLFGPSAVRSYEGNRYTLVIVDDYSRKVEESLNVTFDKTPPPSKTSPLVNDDLDEEEAIKVTEKKYLENDIMDETLEVDEIVNIKESRKPSPLEMS
ncbi:retrovirus-related pol polyprotein from transposon TNT 1-94 [Tanacetum coccineum]